MSALAVFAAVLAGWFWVGPGPDLGRLDSAPEPSVLPPGRVAAVLAVVAAGVLGSIGGWAIGLASAAVAGVSGWGWRRYRRRRTATRERAEVVRSAELVSGLLRLGLVPAAALRTAAAEAPLLTEVAAVQALGGSVGPVLRKAASGPGREGLVELARAWELAERTGASMTASLDAVAQQLVQAAQVRDTVTAELSAPRATGRLLAVLPLAGLGLGYLLGGDPLGFLTGSLPGQICLVLGVALGCAGLVWTEALADRNGG